ncbi:MAG: hypothetical protein IPG04_42450 [Polyangiaceae bacterium]|nr:hypothetical protein [Polyangiaceae bacterium]
MRALFGVSLATALWLVACGASTGSSDAGSASSAPVVEALLVSAAAEPSSIPEPPPSASASASAPQAPKYAKAIEASLKEVTRLRELPAKEPIKSFSLARDALLEKMKKKMSEEIPPGIIELQGESLRSFGLVPVDYELEEGFLKLISARVAGFYDPDEKAMYLIDDLTKAQEDETLPHELVHALQDQAFSIGWMLDYKPGKSDYTAAIQHLVEGDAMLVGMMVTYGDGALDVDTESLRTAFFLSTAMSPVGAATPPIIVSSLVSPYTDGFAFVKGLRAEGGWAAVDAAFKKLPETTEQILHLDKYKSREPAKPVPAIPIGALGPGYAVGLEEANGELALRMMLEQWATLKVAAKAAQGWGGDRYVVVKKKDTEPSYASALFTKMDSATDAAEVAKILKAKLGPKCDARPDLGPLAWTQRGEDIVIVAGPYTKGATVKSAGTCKLAEAWLKEILAAPVTK